MVAMVLLEAQTVEVDTADTPEQYIARDPWPPHVHSR